MRVRLKHPRHHRARGKGEKPPHTDPTASPAGWRSTALRGLPEPAAPPVGKESPWWTLSSPSTVGPFLRVPLQSCLTSQKSAELTTGNQTVMENRAGPCNNQPSDLADRGPTYSTQIAPTSSFTDLQNPNTVQSPGSAAGCRSA